jgi:hypothetical protein
MAIAPPGSCKKKKKKKKRKQAMKEAGDLVFQRVSYMA